jgi:hypothetical protein
MCRQSRNFLRPAAVSYVTLALTLVDWRAGCYARINGSFRLPSSLLFYHHTTQAASMANPAQSHDMAVILLRPTVMAYCYDRELNLESYFAI